MTKNKFASNAPAAKLDQRLWLLLFGCIILLVVVCYANTLAYGIVFNDSLTLLSLSKNAEHSHLGLDTLVRPLTQPWVRQSFLADENNYAESFGWYHLVNVWFHLISCVALFTLVFRLTRRWGEETRFDPYKVAAVAAALYACHPLAVQPATYLSARFAVLGACNFLLSLNFFLLGLWAKSNGPRFWGYALTLVFGWMSLASFETGLALPVVLISLFFLGRPLAEDWKEWAVEHPFVCGILLAVTLAVPFTFVLGFEPAAVPNFYGMHAVHHMQYYATQLKAFITYYARCFVVPIGLALDPPWASASSFADALVIVGLLAFAAVGACLFFARRRPLLLLGLILVLFGFLPHALIPQVDAVSDSAIYLSLSGACILAAALLQPLLASTRRQTAERFVPLLIVLGGLTVAHNLDFQSDRNLIAATMRVNPKSALGYSLLSPIAVEEKKYDEAIADADKAIADDPQAVRAYLAKASALTAQHKDVEAGKVLETASEVAKDQQLSLWTLTKFALMENQLRLHKADEADKLMKTTIFEDPRNPRAAYVLGLIAFERKQYEPAARYLMGAYRSGVTDSLEPLADTANRLHKFTDAIRVADKAVATFPDSQRAKLALANALIGAGDLAVAEKTLNEVLQKSPDSASALALRSLVDERKGDAAKAKADHDAAVAINPNAFSDIVVPPPPTKPKDSDKAKGKTT